MAEATAKQVSFWIDSTPATKFPSLAQEAMTGVSVDVAIVGGGIAGITAAFLLKRAGKTVAILDSHHIATGAGGHTLATVTSLQSPIYADLIQQVGIEKAQIYAESNQTAVERVAALVQEETIDCDFSRQTAYVIGATKDRDVLKKEAVAAAKLGLFASFRLDLPFMSSGAIQVDRQAQIHPRKYLLNLAQKIVGNGSYIFENTVVQAVEEGKPCQVVTDKGVVHAKDVLVTTQIPILNEGLFFAKCHPLQSYVVAAQIAPDQAPEGLLVEANEDHAIRTTPYLGGLLLLVSGETHRVGTATAMEARYQRLEAYAHNRFGVEQFEYRWSTQSYQSFDKLPLIGKLTPLHHHVYVATGLNGEMTQGTLAGMLLSDLVLDLDNPWAELYDSLRISPFVTPDFLQYNFIAGTNFVGDRLKALLDHSIADIPPGVGKVVTIDGKQVAAHRDDDGKVHTVSAVCSHLGCIVNWNPIEKSWDCPCHGARFSCIGKVLQAPAVKDLDQYRL